MEINISEVLRAKKPGLSPLIRVPLTKYLRRIVHEDEVNFYLRSFSHLPPIEFLRATLLQMEINYSSVGMENIDPSGRYIFASNHPFGGLDGLMLADEVYKHFGSVRLIVNDILMNVAPLSPLFIPVNKHGRQNSHYSRQYNESMASDTPIITFPAGLCSRRINGQVTDTPWRSSFVKSAIASERSIVPVYFDGKLSNFFYRLHSLRTKLGIKANIEMLYLVDEMFKQSGSHFKIIIGKPIPCDMLKNGQTASTWAKELRSNAYNLKKMVL